jgi:hypothetical protein
MAKLMPGVRREDLVPAEDPGEGLRIAEVAARQLKAAYGARLRQVVLFGSWVRGEAHEESDVDLIVVLDHIENRARERDRLVEVLYDLEVDSHRAIEAFPVGEADAQSGARPFVAAALRDGTPLLRDRVMSVRSGSSRTSTAIAAGAWGKGRDLWKRFGSARSRQSLLSHHHPDPNRP